MVMSPVHGAGELVNCIVLGLPNGDLMPKIVADDVDRTSMYRIAAITPSSLTGTMIKTDYDIVFLAKCIACSGRMEYGQFRHRLQLDQLKQKHFIRN